MNFKKIAITTAAAGVLLASTVPAFAHEHGRRGGNDANITVENEDTTVTNRVLTVSNTGLNEVDGGHSHRHHGSSNGGSISTGDARAKSDVLNDVNNNTVDVCGCLSDRRGDLNVRVENEDTTVTNGVLTVSNTGLNEVDGRGRVRSGDAAAEGIVTNYVNTNVVK